MTHCSLESIVLDDTGCIPAGTDFLLGGLEMFGDIPS